MIRMYPIHTHCIQYAAGWYINVMEEETVTVYCNILRNQRIAADTYLQRGRRLLRRREDVTITILWNDKKY